MAALAGPTTPLPNSYEVSLSATTCCEPSGATALTRPVSPCVVTCGAPEALGPVLLPGPGSPEAVDPAGNDAPGTGLFAKSGVSPPDPASAMYSVPSGPTVRP